MKTLFIILGYFSLALGIIGVFLPVLPTAPFIILAGFCFSKGSPRLHKWLLERPRLGPILLQWEKYGVIQKKSKWFATICLTVSMGGTVLFLNIPKFAKIIMPIVGASVLVFIWTRPSQIPMLTTRDREKNLKNGLV